MLASVAGTIPAQEALIANSVPQTATVQREQATLDVKYDGGAKFVSIAGTTLSYAQNTPIPVIKVTPTSYYALHNAVWFVGNDPYGPWTVATSVPTVIYAIPATSPVHYVTYVRIYGVTPDVVYVGYTPGYMGTVVAPYGTVVYGTGYAYAPWVGAVWYAPPMTYGFGATVAYSTWGGWNVGFGVAYPVYPPYWGPYAYGAGFARGHVHRHGDRRGGVGLGLARWLQCHREQRVQPLGLGDRQAHGNTYNYNRVGNTTVSRSGNNVYASRDGNVYQQERPVAEVR